MKHKKTLFGVLVGAILGLFAISAIPELKAITRNAKAVWYEPITSVSSLTNDDEVILKTDSGIGVTGWTKKASNANVSEIESEWKKYLVKDKSGSNFALYDSVAVDSKNYIYCNTAKADFTYESTSQNLIVTSSGYVGAGTRVLQYRNDSGTKYYRFYTEDHGTMTGTFEFFKLYKVQEYRLPISITTVKGTYKTSYNAGESFDPTGLVITVKYGDDSTEDIAYDTYPTRFTFTPSGSLTTENTSVTVAYGGQSIAFAITVASLGVKSIAVTTQPDKTTYFCGDTLDTTGLVVTGTFNDDSTGNVTSGCTYSPTTMTMPGTQTITVTHTESSKTTTFDVAVNIPPKASKYRILKDDTQLDAGDEIIISAAGDYDYAMSSTDKNDRYAGVAAAKDDSNEIIPDMPDEAMILTLENGSSTGSFAFKNTNNKYIAAVSGKSELTTKTAIDADCSWTFTIDDTTGVASIHNVGQTTRYLMFNKSGTCAFGGYTSATGDIVDVAVFTYVSGKENLFLSDTELLLSTTDEVSVHAQKIDWNREVTYEFTSSDTDVFTLTDKVGDSVKVVAAGEGTATLTCVAHDSENVWRQAICTVTVHDYDHSAITPASYYLLDRTFYNGLSAEDVTKNIEDIDLTDVDNLFNIIACNQADNAYYIMLGDEFLERAGSQARLELKDVPTTYWIINKTSTTNVYNITDTNGNKLQFASNNTGIKWIAAPTAYYTEYLQIGLVGAQVFDHLSYTGTPSKTTYNVGETFSTEGITVKAHYTDIQKDVTDKIVWDTFSVGDTKATGRITISDVERTIEVTGIQVTDYRVDSLSVDASGALTKYFVGQSLDKTGLVITATYKDAAGIGDDRVNEPVALDNPGLTFSPETMQADTTKVTVSLGGKSTHYAVSVVAKQYFRATNLAKGDRVIFVDEVYAVEMAKTETKDFDKVEYSYYPDPVGDKATVLEVVDGVEKGMKAFKNVETNKYIAISGTKALEYTDTVTLESSWTTDVSKYETIDYHIICNAKSTDKYMKYNPDGDGKFAVGNAPSSGFCVYRENVSAESIELSGDYKTTFNKGDTFEFGGTVTATLSNSKTRDVTSECSFTGYDMNVAGQYTVTVSYYLGKTVTTTYVITVEDGGSGGGDTSSTTSSDTSSGSGSSTTSGDTSSSSGTSSTTSSTTSEDQGGGNSPINRLVAAIGVVGAVAVIGGSFIVGPAIIGGIVVGIIFIAKAAKKKK